MWKKTFTVERTERYNQIGRKLLDVKKISKESSGFHLRKKIASVAHVIGRRGTVPDRIVEGEDVLIPCFEIAVLPIRRYFEDVSKKDIRNKTIDAIKKLEDTEILRCVEAASRKYQTVNAPDDILLDEHVNDAFSMIETHGVKPDKILVHPRQFASIRKFDDFKKGWFPKLNKWLFGHSGKLWGKKVYVSNRVIEGDVYIFPKKEFLGVLVIRQDIKCKLHDDIKNFRETWMFYESIGICVVNDYAFSKVHVMSKEETRIERKRAEFLQMIDGLGRREIKEMMDNGSRELVHFASKYQYWNENHMSSSFDPCKLTIQMACNKLKGEKKTPAYIYMSEKSLDYLSEEITKKSYHVYGDMDLKVIVTDFLDDDTLVVLAEEFDGSKYTIMRITNLKQE